MTLVELCLQTSAILRRLHIQLLSHIHRLSQRQGKNRVPNHFMPKFSAMCAAIPLQEPDTSAWIVPIMINVRNVFSTLIFRLDECRDYTIVGPSLSRTQFTNFKKFGRLEVSRQTPQSTGKMVEKAFIMLPVICVIQESVANDLLVFPLLHSCMNELDRRNVQTARISTFAVPVTRLSPNNTRLMFSSKSRILAI